MEHKVNIRPDANSQRIFDVLLDALDDGIWIWSIAQGKYDIISPAARSIFGSDLDLYNQDPEKWVYLIHPEDREDVLFATTKTLFTLGKVSLQYRIENDNGSYRWIKDQRKLIKDIAGQPIQIFGQVQDITEQKYRERRLEESEMSYKIMFWQHPNPIWVVSCPDGRILETNEAAIKHYGYTRKEFASINFFELTQNKESIMDSTSKGFARSIATLVKKNNKETKALITSADYTHIGKKAKLIMAIDITREISDEEKIKSLNKRLSDFKYALTSSAIVSITDKQGIIKYVNDNFVKISGYNRQELIGSPHSIVNSGYHSQQFFKNLWETISSGNIWRNEIRNRAKNGTQYWVDTYIIPLLDKEKKPYQYISIRSDIMHQKQIEAELAELNKQLEERVKKRTQDLELANRSLQDFANSISHDLRAPVRHIRNFAQLVLEESQEVLSEESRNYQGYVIEATQKLSKQIEGLLQFSRVGSKLINFMEVDIEKMVHYTFDQAKYQYPLQKCQFHINQQLPDIMADQVLLEQVFANLFSNAIKYSSKMPESIVWLNYTDMGNFHQFEVKDNGAGFDMKYAAKLFNMFSRLHSESEFEGNGIGLVNVKKIIERHQGKIWVHSEPNKGTSFFFTLPKHLENENLNDD